MSYIKGAHLLLDSLERDRVEVSSPDDEDHPRYEECGIIRSETNREVLEVLLDLLEEKGDRLADLVRDPIFRFDSARFPLQHRVDDLETGRQELRERVVALMAPFYPRKHPYERVLVHEWEYGWPAGATIAMQPPQFPTGPAAPAQEQLEDIYRTLIGEPRLHRLKKLGLVGDDVLDAFGAQADDYAAVTGSVEDLTLFETAFDEQAMESFGGMRLPSLRKLELHGFSPLLADGIAVLAQHERLGSVESVKFHCSENELFEAMEPPAHYQFAIRALVNDSSLFKNLKAVSFEGFYNLFDRRADMDADEFMQMFLSSPEREGLEEVEMIACGLTKLQPVTSLTGCENLRRLDLHGNSITTPPETILLWFEAAAFRDSLRSLRLWSAFDRDLFPDEMKGFEERIRQLFPNLEELDL